MCLPPDPLLVGEGWRATWLERLANAPLFFEIWLQHQRRDSYWKRGSVCEDYSAIQCPVYAVGGWTDAYKNTIPRLLAGLTVPRKGLIGPWAHAYPHFALPGPQVGFLQEMLRWWDYWLKGIDTGAMDEPMLRAWMMESVRPASHHETLPGRWIAESSWPSPGITPRRLFLTDEGLRDETAPLTARAVCSPQTVGKCGGNWVPFGRGHDQAGDQGEDDLRSLVFETPPLDAPIELLGAAIVTLDVASDRPMANLVVRLCDVHPSGESLRVSFGVLNLTRRNGHEKPELLAIGERYRVRIQLNDAGSVFPAGHRVRLALSTAYWPMIWPCPEKATLLISGGALDLPVRPPSAADALLSPLPDPEHLLPRDGGGYACHEVAARYRKAHARRPHGLRHINTRDFGVSMRRSKDCHVQHVRQLHVIDVAALAGHKPEIFTASQRLTDVAKRAFFDHVALPIGPAAGISSRSGRIT
jgi:predicted acyl esterase